MNSESQRISKRLLLRLHALRGVSERRRDRNTLGNIDASQIEENAPSAGDVTFGEYASEYVREHRKVDGCPSFTAFSRAQFKSTGTRIRARTKRF